MFKSKKCKIENCTYSVWSNGFCKMHNPKNSNYRIKSTYKKKDSPNKMHEFFMTIWKERKHYSEISNTYLGKEPSSAFFHHILPKSKYKEAAFDKNNIILLSLAEHDNVEMDMYRYEKINKIREELLKKY